MKKPAKVAKKIRTSHKPPAKRPKVAAKAPSRKEVGRKPPPKPPKAAQKPAAPVRVAPRLSAPAVKTAPAPPLPDGREQTQAYDKAMGLFHAGEFARAKTLFEQAITGPNREMGHAARLHVRMCEHRMVKATPEPSTPEERYNYAVALINRRELETAEQQLHLALQEMENGDHLHYAMALCRGLRGDLQGAYQHLKRAIELQPQNRVVARNDPDFREIGYQHPLRELLFP